MGFEKLSSSQALKFLPLLIACGLPAEKDTDVLFRDFSARVHQVLGDNNRSLTAMREDPENASIARRKFHDGSEYIYGRFENARVVPRACNDEEKNKRVQWRLEALITHAEGLLKEMTDTASNHLGKPVREKIDSLKKLLEPPKESEAPVTKDALVLQQAADEFEEFLRAQNFSLPAPLAILPCHDLHEKATVASFSVRDGRAQAFGYRFDAEKKCSYRSAKIDAAFTKDASGAMTFVDDQCDPADDSKHEVTILKVSAGGRACEINAAAVSSPSRCTTLLRAFFAAVRRAVSQPATEVPATEKP